MRFVAGILLYVLFSGLVSVDTLRNSFCKDKITTNTLQRQVEFLSSDALGGRLTGTAGEQLATQYVADVFHRLGLEPAGDNGTFFQEFEFTSRVGSKKHGRNVLAKLKMRKKNAQTLVIGAHIDHLGHGELSGSRSRANEKGMIHYGADDNASGIAALLAAAAALSDMELHGNKDIIFAAWSGEEIGLLGSSHFVKDFIKKTNTNTLTANINLDMVGRLKDKLIIQGAGSSSMWPKLIERANSQQSIPIITQNDPYLPTDSTSFYLHKVPTLNLFTGSHEEYHTPRDKPETLNYKGIKHISEFLRDLILTLETETVAIDFKEVPKTGNQHGRGFKVYLGTIPDYAHSDVSGVQLSGVAKDSPADKAGLKQDDVIIELSGKTIHDIYDYTSVLSALHVGESVALIVLRGHEKVTLTIVARARE